MPYKIIVEEDEYKEYSSVIDPQKILVLPKEYKTNYDTFWHDGDPTTGAGAARNFAWDHSIEQDFDHHWVVDDNISRFLRVNNNAKPPVTSGTIFKVMEDFVLRYENVAIAGPNYRFFVNTNAKYPPFYLNNRVYSCLLIKNDIPFRWRGRYNEDVDLNIRVLKAGYCVISFNAFLQEKAGTQKIKGGNTEQFYSKEGTWRKSKMLEEMHPDVARITWRFNRCHHYVDYRSFKKNKLIKKADLVISEGINNYGMKLVKVEQ